MDAIDKNTLQKSYDEVPYLSEPFPDSSPEHVASVARLFGLDFIPPQQAKVLELGCASGGNIIPLAQLNPKSSYIGIDLSPVQIKEGEDKIKALGLENISLKAMNLAEITPEFGKFDYLICHGVYSWVPEDVRRAVLRICRENLSPKGFAFVSYNTYPGWRFKEVLRDAMLFRGSKFKQPQQILANARGMVNFMHEMTAEGSLMKHFLDTEINQLRNAQSHYIFHDHLEPFNTPCYFRDFVAETEQQGLCYVAETEVQSMFVSNLGEKVAGPILNEANGDQIVLEQYMDFLKNRSFRQSILTHHERKPLVNYKLKQDGIREFNYSGTYQSREKTVELDYLPHTFYTLRNGFFSVSQPIEKAALLELTDHFPATLKFREILEGAQKRLGTKLPTHGEIIAHLLEQLITRGFIKTRIEPVKAGFTIQEKPLATDAARKAVRNVPSGITNVWHEKVIFDVVEQHLLPMMDGTNTQNQLSDHIYALAKQGILKFSRDGKPVILDEEIKACAIEHTENRLLSLRAKAVLQ